MSKIQNFLIDKINKNEEIIDNWFREKFLIKKPIFYNSIDLRHSGFKIAPIDNNCFPAGFNNLSDQSKIKAKNIVKDFFDSQYHGVKKVLIIPENHTRNLKYLENVISLKNIIENSKNIEVIIGSLIEDIEDKLTIDLENNKKIELHKIHQKNGKISTSSGFEADLIITNNDFTNEPEAILHDISQEIIPPKSIGWHKRKKSKHFDIYEKLTIELGELLDLDPWIIDPIHQNSQNLDFKNKVNIENLANQVDEVLKNVKKKYKEYNVDLEPYCYVKADSGTYGMAMMTVINAKDILEINKKQRNKMNMIKGNIINSQVIIQEGIPTIDKIDNMICEPMIYLINGQTIGNLSRINNNRDQNISLNAAGMSFKDMENIDQKDLFIGGNKEDIFKIYSLVGRLSSLAATFEQDSY